jgi:hypothetical protein
MQIEPPSARIVFFASLTLGITRPWTLTAGEYMILRALLREAVPSEDRSRCETYRFQGADI